MSTRDSLKFNNNKWITQTEAARLRRVAFGTIASLLRRGRLRGKVVNGRQMVFREDVVTFKPATGRPSKDAMEAAVASVNRDQWVTQKEAAQLRGCTVHSIRGAIMNGRIRTLKSKGVVFVKKEDVLNYRPRIDFRPEVGPQSALPPGAKAEEWITVAEAARIRGVNQGTITGHVTSKRIRSVKTGDTRLVYREDIINFKRKPGPGRPKKK